jgi:hypothetical protein
LLEIAFTRNHDTRGRQFSSFSLYRILKPATTSGAVIFVLDNRVSVDRFHPALVLITPHPSIKPGMIRLLHSVDTRITRSAL